MNKCLIYQVLPRLWGAPESSNGRFGDFDSETLNYIKKLGATHIWFTGIIRHATPPSVAKGNPGSPFAISDWYDVNPYLADNPEARMDEFRAMVARIHDCGLKILLDFIPNHTAREYDGACTPKGIPTIGQNDDKNLHWAPQNDYYYYPGQRLKMPEGFFQEYEEFPAKASGNCFSPAPGVNDWWETVKLNYCDFHTPTWDRMYEVLKFWALQGIDGFRCDMVELVPAEFFSWAISKIKEEFPSLIFVAEAYELGNYDKYLSAGFDLLYDKSGMYDCLRAATESGNSNAISAARDHAGRYDGQLLYFMENHDEHRIASDFFAQKAERGLASMAVSLLLDKMPAMIYAGQEVGERGMDSEPFSGLNGRTSIFEFWRVGSLCRLWNSIHGTGEGLSKDERNILKEYKKLIALSKKEVFKRGLTYDLSYCQDNANGTYAFLRALPAKVSSKGRRAKVMLVVCNFGFEDSNVRINIPTHASEFLGVSLPPFAEVKVAAGSYSLIEL